MKRTVFVSMLLTLIFGVLSASSYVPGNVIVMLYKERNFSFRYRIKTQYVTGHKIDSPTSNRVFGGDTYGMLPFTDRGQRSHKKIIIKNKNY